ncbi:MAG: ATP-binding cassette domain-containing protein, partial [Gammaproteobacteria bacterium]
GYHSLIGDMGTVLSGGQQQRILLARALYRRPRMLFLDEATSYLDLKRESRINEAIRHMKITRIMVAHRIETLRYADRVIILSAHGVSRCEPVENGQIVRMRPRGGSGVPIS